MKKTGSPASHTLCMKDMRPVKKTTSSSGVQKKKAPIKRKNPTSPAFKAIESALCGDKMTVTSPDDITKLMSTVEGELKNRLDKYIKQELDGSWERYTKVAEQIGRTCAICFEPITPQEKHIFDDRDWLTGPEKCKHSGNYHLVCFRKMTVVFEPLGVKPGDPPLSVHRLLGSDDKRIVLQPADEGKSFACAIAASRCPECRAIWQAPAPSTYKIAAPNEDVLDRLSGGRIVVAPNQEKHIKEYREGKYVGPLGGGIADIGMGYDSYTEESDGDYSEEDYSGESSEESSGLHEESDEKVHPENEVEKWKKREEEAKEAMERDELFSVVE